MASEKMMHTDLHIAGREMLKLNGVTNIESFDPDYVALIIDGGRLTVEGEGLKIESLSRDNGEIEIKGSIRGVFYTNKAKREGIFSKLFK